MYVYYKYYDISSMNYLHLYFISKPDGVKIASWVYLSLQTVIILVLIWNEEKCLA